MSILIQFVLNAGGGPYCYRKWDIRLEQALAFLVFSIISYRHGVMSYIVSASTNCNTMSHL